MNAIMLVIMKVIFSGTGSGTGIGVGIGRDVVKILCLFFAAGHFAKAEQMNVLSQLHVVNRQNAMPRYVDLLGDYQINSGVCLF